MLLAAWLGFALAALVLYPLAVALESDIFYLQWQRRDTVETVAALALLSIVFAALVYVLWPRTGRVASAALALVAAGPVLSFLAGFARQLPFDDALAAAGNNRALGLAVTLTAAAAATTLFVRRPDLFARWLRRGILAISFVSVVVIESVVTAASYASPPIAVEPPRQADAAAGTAACPSIVALLFDELSFTYLYDGWQVRPEYPALRRLSETATNYLNVRAPADETLVAMPAYLAARELERVQVTGMDLFEVKRDGRLAPFDAAAADGLVGTARRNGYRTEIAGYYLPYCSLLGAAADACASLSFYNASTVRDGLSPLNPIRTALIMWPRQFPFGVVKNVPFAGLQRGLVERLSAFARRPLAQGPVFRFVHFSVPHLPFVFDEGGYNPPLNPLQTSPDTGYQRQLRYVDRLAGEIVAGMQQRGELDRTTLVVLADHGFRFGGRERDRFHIPFIVKRAGQRSRSDVADPQRGELLLHDIVEGSCEAH